MPNLPGTSRAKKGLFRPAGLLLSVYGIRRKAATVSVGLLALSLGYHVIFGQNGLLVYQQKRLDARTLDGELSTLSRENERLRGHIDRLQSDPDAIEQQAREELHYARPDEVIYTMPAGNAQVQAAAKN